MGVAAGLRPCGATAEGCSILPERAALFSSGAPVGDCLRAKIICPQPAAPFAFVLPSLSVLLPRSSREGWTVETVTVTIDLPVYAPLSATAPAGQRKLVGCVTRGDNVCERNLSPLEKPLLSFATPPAEGRHPDVARLFA